MSSRRAAAIAAVLAASGCGPGVSVLGAPPIDAGDPMDAPEPAFDSLVIVRRDAPEVPPECRMDRDCDDGVGCTVDACREERCVHAPLAALCPAGSACEPGRGCRAQRACATDAVCADDDPCTVTEHCDPDRHVCVTGELPEGTPCGAQASGRICRGGACQCPSDRSVVCGGACADLATDPRNCGSCGTACLAGAWCDGGRCACATPQSYCAGTGCVDLSADTGNCGACGTACLAGAQCASGRCVAPCGAGTHRCGADCLADDSVRSCGARCDPCPFPAGAVAICSTSASGRSCDFTCPSGTHRCGALCVRSDAVETCGTSCAPCVRPDFGSVSCVAGACAVSCDAGFHACGSTCARDTDAVTCGSRCSPCPATPHGAATCVAGACGVSCDPGFRSCNGACTDGTSPLGCGPSCTRCPVPANGAATCVAGVCGVHCDPGAHACGTTCALDASPLSCGGRCDPCPAPSGGHATCDAGTCDFACDAGFVRDGTACRTLPRRVWPPPAVHVTVRRPTLRWVFPADADPAAADSVVEVCRDPGCRTVLTTLPAAGNQGVPSADLPLGPLFWRVRAGTRSSGTASFVADGPFRAPGPGGGGAVWGVVPDFDGDGYDDLAVGMPFRSVPAPAVAIFRGSSVGLGNTPAAMLVAPGSGAGQFGFGVAALGDVDGDGLCDLAVGAPGGASGLGQVFVYLGSSAGLRPVPAAVLTGPDAATSQFGATVAAAGDVDGDGFADLLVGAYQGSGTGRAYVYRGSAAGIATTPSWALAPGGTAAARFGVSVAGAGDVDGDGFADLLVGADLTGGNTGAVHLFRGSAAGLGSAATRVLLRADGGQYGAAVAAVGDVDGDGLPDFAAGAPNVVSGTGQVLVYRGPSALATGAAAWVLAGTGGTGAQFGAALAPLGDADHDGYADLVVGAPQRSSYGGAAYVFHGGTAGFGAAAAQSFLADTAPSYLGGSFGALRDFDGDGWADLAVGGERTMGFQGRVTVYAGGPAGFAVYEALDGGAGGTRFGYSLACWAAPRRVRGG